MTGMDIFNLVAGLCSILGLLISLLVAKTVHNISKQNHQKAKASGNAQINQAGNDINLK